MSHVDQCVSCFQHRSGLSSLSSSNRMVSPAPTLGQPPILLVDDGSPLSPRIPAITVAYATVAASQSAIWLSATISRNQQGKERKSVTETDLVTAGDSAEQAELPNTVKSEFSSPATPDTPIGAPAAEPTPTAEVPKDSPSGSLFTSVLPELRELSNEVGVKGASGMRKSELIAAIRERRKGPRHRRLRRSPRPKRVLATTPTDSSSGSAPAENAVEDHH